MVQAPTKLEECDAADGQDGQGTATCTLIYDDVTLSA
jgi:hypothetical protein